MTTAKEIIEDAILALQTDCDWNTRNAAAAALTSLLQSFTPPGLRPALAEFATVMEDKLRANDHKVHWSTCVISYLLELLTDEVGELEEALLDQNPGQAKQEAADVANFAMMIFNNL